jgi:hypothetical protein
MQKEYPYIFANVCEDPGSLLDFLGITREKSCTSDRNNIRALPLGNYICVPEFGNCALTSSFISSIYSPRSFKSPCAASIQHLHRHACLLGDDFIIPCSGRFCRGILPQIGQISLRLTTLIDRLSSM